METSDPTALLEQLLALRGELVADGERTVQRWQPGIEREEFEPSARNLAHYLSLRRRDVRDLQNALMPWGLSSLGRLESRVLANVDAVIATLGRLAGSSEPALPERPALEEFFAGEEVLDRNTTEVFGRPHRHRHVRIMVTLPAQAGTDYGLIHDLVEAGTDCLRINCAHDTEQEWAGMIANVRRAGRELDRPARVVMDLAGQKPRTEEVVLPGDRHRLQAGDTIRLTAEPPREPGAQPFQVRCSTPEVLDQLEEGAGVTFDDGRMATVVRRLEGRDAVLEVTHTPSKGGKLRPALGLNFPDSSLRLDPLTPKDLRDLDFVVAHADLVGYSFVQRRSDVELLQDHLEARGRRRMPLMAKIETPTAVRNLPELIVQAASRQPFAVMIARGDLAVELGYRRLAEMQEEILWLCEAAHVPVIWATEVLDRLARKGSPTRAEVTDAAMSERAECVMLNKGPAIVEAVRMLDDLLTRMQTHQTKKTPRLRALRSWAEVAG